MKLTFALIASALAIAGNLPYIIDVVKGKVQPHAYSWFVWSLVSGVVFFGQLVKGAGIGALPTAVAELLTLVIFLLSLRYGFKEKTRSDRIFLAIALLGLIPWALTKDPTLSVITVVGIDIAAFIPTLRKTWVKPHTENQILYVMNVLRHALGLLSLQTYNIATALHSVAMIIANTLMTAFIARRNNRT